MPVGVQSVLDTCGMNWEIIVVDDGSRDRTSNVWGIGANNRASGVRFSRNLARRPRCCRLNHARGDAVVTIDADLQHPRA